MHVKFILIRKENKTKFIETDFVIKNLLCNVFYDVTFYDFKFCFNENQFVIEYDYSGKRNGIYYLNFNFESESDDVNAELLDAVSTKFRLGEHRKEFNILVRYDGVSEFYCSKIYPKFSQSERLLRELILTVIVKALGKDWSIKTIPKAMRDKIKERAHGLNQGQIIESILEEMTINELEDYLFKPMNEDDPLKVINDLSLYKLKKMNKDDIILMLSGLKMISVWDKYFINENIFIKDIRENLESIRKYRNKVAHNKEFSKQDYEICNILLSEFISSIQKAIENIPDINLNQIISISHRYAEYGEDLYYWEYNKKSYINKSLFAIYYPQVNIEKNLVVLHNDGMKETIFNACGVDDIYIVNNRVYFHDYKEENDYEIYSLDLHGKDLRFHGKGQIKDIDDKKNYIIVNTNEENRTLYSINSTTFETKTLYESTGLNSYDSYLGVKDSIIYFSSINNKSNKQNIYSMDVDGSNKNNILTLSASKYEDNRIPCFKIVEDNIYLSVGCYSGTAHVYQGGFIATMKTDGSQYRVLLEEANDNFIIIKKNDKWFLNTEKYYEDTTISIDLSTGKFTTLGHHIHAEYQPFINEDCLWVYEDFREEPNLLIKDIEKKFIVPIQDKLVNSDLYGIANIEVHKNYIVICVEASRYNPKDDIGWRMSYKLKKGIAFVYNRNNANVKKIFKY